jgi:hypothetical protein
VRAANHVSTLLPVDIQRMEEYITQRMAALTPSAQQTPAPVTGG